MKRFCFKQLNTLLRWSVRWSALGIALTASSSSWSTAKTCAQLMASLSQDSLSQDEAWRASLTHRNHLNTFSKSSPAREAQMKLAKADMEDEIYGRGKYSHGDVPEMRYFPAEGVITTLTRAPQPYGSGVYPEITVSGLGPKGELPLTLMLPVSGHTGLANALKWAKTDTYTLYIVDAAKNRRNLVVDAPSLDLVTFQDLIVPLKANEKVTLYYHRSGSGGPSGYIEGRALDIIWDGK